MVSPVPVIMMSLLSGIVGLLFLGPVGFVLGVVVGGSFGGVIATNAEREDDRIDDLEQRVNELDSEN